MTSIYFRYSLYPAWCTRINWGKWILAETSVVQERLRARDCRSQTLSVLLWDYRKRSPSGNLPLMHMTGCGLVSSIICHAFVEIVASPAYKNSIFTNINVLIKYYICFANSKTIIQYIGLYYILLTDLLFLLVYYILTSDISSF